MKALITGTPVQIEGEPAEIAQLVELMSSGAVMVEHVHQWRLGQPDENGVTAGRCWCGTERNFAPFGEAGTGQFSGTANAHQRGEAPSQMKRASGRVCKICKQSGHDSRKCPEKAAA